ncbi:MAG: Uma2 family endonuclease, partial [Bacteroidota bacterium]
MTLLTTFLPLQTLDDLLGDLPFLVLGNEQILFRDAESDEIILTNIRRDQSYTQADYDALPEGAPYELIDGKLIFMPSPTFQHQETQMYLSSLLDQYIRKNKLGKVVTAPMDVRLDERNVVQPDILFVSLKRKAIIGKFIE